MDSWFVAGAATERPSGLRLFAQAADTNRKIIGAQQQSIISDIWASRIALYMQAIALPLAFWFKPVCVCIALFWLSYRAYRVLYKPLDDLATLLGFDIPNVPIIDLAGIKADGAIIHWSLPEKQKYKSTFKYEIHLNGTIVDTVSMSETAVTVSGLRPGSYYVVRIALVTNLEFSSRSAPIRFRTKPESSGDFFHVIPDGHDAEHDAFQEPLLRVKAYRGLKDIAPASADSPPSLVHRESAVNLARRRSNTGRRASPATATIEQATDRDGEVPDVESDTIQRLTEKLDSLRRETEEADRMAREEEEEELKLKEELIKERDDLRAEVAEKEKASRNLKREVNVMERQNTASQNERSKHERLLQQKIHEREKLKEDMVKWTTETAQMQNDIERIKQQKTKCIEQVQKEQTILRQRLADETGAIRGLEEDIKETTAEIKKVERTGKNPSPSNDAHFNLVEQVQHDVEEDRQWNLQIYELQQKYTAAAQRLEQSKRFYASNMQYLEGIRERRRIDEAAAASAIAAAAAAASNRDLASPPGTQERLPSRRDSQRSRRENSGALTDSPRTTTFGAQPVFGTGLSSGFTNGSLFGFSNGLAVATNSLISDEDREKLTGGAMMSPGAGEGLLPADLFASDDRSTENVLPLPGLGSLPGMLPGLGQQPAADYGPGPASPASVSSRAASTFASPQASQQNLNNHIGTPEGVIDSDRRSIRSNRSGRAMSGANATSRFSAMFGIRQRAKNNALDNSLGLPLGKTHSHSMPRQDNGLPGLDSMTRKRNSSLSGSAFENGVDVEGESAVAESAENPAQSRRRPFTLNPFSKDKATDGWPSSFSGFGRRPASPKPESTHSGELPRPSFDSNRWGVDTWQPGENGARASPLSLGGWNVPVNSTRSFTSRHQSRRTSLQHGVTSPPDDIIEDEDSDILDPDLEPHLAPIGTMPTISTDDKQSENRLNPNAKDFKSLFSGMRARDKGKGKATDSGSKASTPGPSSTPIPGKDSVEDDSPPQSRKSRDARSTTTLESSAAEGSRRNSSDLVLSPSFSNSEAAYSPQIGAASSLGKESFMQKITRKSSSSKFTLPTFKRDKKFEAQSPALPPTEDDEDAMSASIGSLKEPRESSEKGRGNARSWSNVLKIGKKKNGGGDTPSISELSTASERTGGGDDVDE